MGGSGDGGGLVGQVALDTAQVGDGIVAGLAAQEGVGGLPAPALGVAVGETHDCSVAVLAEWLAIRLGRQPAVALGRAVAPLGLREVAQTNIAVVYAEGVLIHEHDRAGRAGIADGGEFLASLTHFIDDGAGARPGILALLINDFAAI